MNFRNRLFLTSSATLAAGLFVAACSLTPGGDTDSNGSDTNSSETGGETDGTTMGTAGPGDCPVTPVTINEVQMGAVGLDCTVTIEDVVVAAPLLRDKNENGTVFIGHPEGGQWSGIQMYMYAEVADSTNLKMGDKITVTGMYTEYFDTSQLVIGSAQQIVKNGTGSLPTPTVVASSEAGTEPYEGVVIRIENPAVTDDSLGFGDFMLDNGNIVLTNDYLYDAGEDFNPKNGDSFAALIGPVIYSFEQFKIAPRTWDDVVDWDQGDTTTTGDPTDTDTTTDTTTTGDPEDVTVYDIQQEMVPENTIVTIKDVIVTTPMSFNTKDMFVQEADGGEYSGIHIYIPGAMDPGLAVGDIVTVTGEYQEFYDESQIVVYDIADITSTGSGPAPTPISVDANDVKTGGPMQENYEGVLVQVSGVEVTAVDDMFGEWEVSDGLVMENMFFDNADWPSPMLGDPYAELTGVLTYNYEKARLAPRTPSDIVGG